MKPIKGIIKPSELSAFTRSRNGLNSFMIIFLYALASALIQLAHWMSTPVMTVFCMLLMGGIQHTIATFIHEAAHGHVFSRKTLNDKLGHFLFAAPLFSYLEDYRYFHWEHHRHTGKMDKDPELELYRYLGVKASGLTGRDKLKVYLQSILGIHAFKGLLFLNRFYLEKRKQGLIKKPALFEHACVGFWALLVPLLMWKMDLLGTYFLIWIVPMFTVFTTLLLWHGFGEHIREKEGCLSQNTFTHRFDMITTLFLYPINSSFHLEHHLFPQLPWHSLKEFRKWAEEKEEYKKMASTLEVDSYFLGEKSILKKSF